MDKWEWERVYRNKGGSAISPSFSSSLLDAIDRSIDDGDGARHPPAQIDPARNHHQEAYNHNHPTAYAAHPHDEAALAHGGYAHRVAGSNNNNNQASLHLPQSKQRKGGDRDRGRRSSVCSVSSSSESSSAGGFSSSEAESVAALSVRTRKPPLAVGGLADRSARLSERDVPAAVKAEAAARKAKLQQQQQHQADKLQSQQQQQQHKDGAGTIKGRIRASRIYGELKKARSPVSPGGRLASFLNTLFTNANTRGGGGKSKSLCTSPRESAQRHHHHNQQQQQQQCPLPLPINPPRLLIPPRPVPARDAGPAVCTEDDSLCSSASSYSRSCLSKTPSTHGGTKRSVRFCPVNVIVEDNYSRRFFQEKKPAFDAAAVYPYAPAAGATGPKHLAPRPPVEVDGDVEFYDDEDDDGTASCSSSDLFELENLAGVGASRYVDELPVYETTHLRTNRAIAQGLVV